MTSHDVVAFIRRVSGIKKVGHTGTLDPGAAGVLPVCLGKATKIVDYIMNDRKTYICDMKLGNSTDTYDKYGKFLYDEPLSYELPGEEEFKKLLLSFTGEISQRPPAYSAVKINGKRAYDLARQGEIVDIKERRVKIYELKLLKYSHDSIILSITCSKGTYIRSICNDIGEALKCHGYMNFLLRSRTGCFTLDNCYTLEEINKDNIKDLLVSAASCLDMEEVYLDMKYEAGILNGNSIRLNSETKSNEQYVKIYLENGQFIGIGNIKMGILYVEKLLC